MEQCWQLLHEMSKTLVLRMEALGSLSEQWLHGEVSINHKLGLK